MREQGLEQKIVREVKKRGGLCLKWVSPGFSGVPDRIIFLPGKIIFAEIKRPGRSEGRSERQKRVAEQLTKLGCIVLTVSSMEDLDGYL